MSTPNRPDDLMDWLRQELLNRRPQQTATPRREKAA